MRTFSRYFDPSIKEWVDTPELHRRVVEIRNMNVNEVVACSENLQSECRIDPSYENTQEFRVLAKTTMRVIQECRNRGDELTAPTKPITAGGVFWAIASGIVMGEIASDLWSGQTGQGGIKQYLKPQK